MSALVLFRLPLVQKETHFAVFLGVLHSKFLGVLLSSEFIFMSHYELFYVILVHPQFQISSSSQNFIHNFRGVSLITSEYVFVVQTQKIFLESFRYPNMCSLYIRTQKSFVKVFVNRSPTVYGSSRRSYGNPDKTGDSLHTATGTVLYQIQHSQLIVWHSYSSFTFLCVHDERSLLGQSLVHACKEGVSGSLLPGVTLGVQPLCGSSIEISGLIYQMHIIKISVRVTFHSTSILSSGGMKLHS
ncbi:uncharacterized protein TNCV_2116321 [Trichonephila clavipes]|nr:uncharacterized protein TNCV_2116321 [Trichonephila clavipes]